MRHRQYVTLGEQVYSERRNQVLEAQEAWPLAGSHKLEKQRPFFVGELLNDVPKILNVCVIQITSKSSVFLPVLNVDRAGARDQIVQLSVIEHLDPLFVYHRLQPPTDEPSLSLEGLIHFVIYQQAYILHLVITMLTTTYSVTRILSPLGTRSITLPSSGY